MCDSTILGHWEIQPPTCDQC
ncbi:hypothetical protein LINPERPRIM_LOCUS15095 [Linum perenne]